MDQLIIRRVLQVLTGILLGLAVVSVVVLGFPGIGSDPRAEGLPLNLSEGPGQGGPPGAFLLDDPYPAPPFALQTPDGRTVTGSDLEGRVTVVFFGFASCPDVCPITLGNLSRALEVLTAAGDGPGSASPPVQVLFVSVDPRRDTPEVLSRYMERFHPHMTAVTGPESEVREVARAWGIHVAYVQLSDHTPDPHEGHTHPGEAATGVAEIPDPSDLPFPDDAGDYTVDHTARSLVVDTDGRVAGTLAPYLTPEEIVEALRPLLDF